MVLCFFGRNCNCSLQFNVQEQSSTVSVHLETVWFWSASDGDEDLDWSGRDDKQSARAARSSLWHATTDYVLCGERHHEYDVRSSIRPLWSRFPALHFLNTRGVDGVLICSWAISCTARFSILQEGDRYLLQIRKGCSQFYHQEHRCLHTGLQLCTLTQKISHWPQWVKQEAQLLQRDRATLCVSKFMLCLFWTTRQCDLRMIGWQKYTTYKTIRPK